MIKASMVEPNHGRLKLNIKVKISSKFYKKYFVSKADKVMLIFKQEEEKSKSTP